MSVWLGREDENLAGLILQLSSILERVTFNVDELNRRSDFFNGEKVTLEKIELRAMQATCGAFSSLSFRFVGFKDLESLRR